MRMFGTPMRMGLPHGRWDDSGKRNYDRFHVRIGHERRAYKDGYKDWNVGPQHRLNIRFLLLNMLERFLINSNDRSP